MTGERAHAEIQDLLGAYALDAVDADERVLIERHVADCPRCRAEVDAHLEAAAMIAQGGTQPPTELWTRISESLQHSAKEADPPHSLSEHRGGSRKRHSRGIRLGGILAAGAAAAAIAVLAVKVVDQGQEIDRLRPDISAAASAALTSADAQRVALRSKDGSVAVDAVLLPDGTGYLVHNNLAPLPETKTYQLWAIVGKKVISAGILGRRPGVAAFQVQRPIDGLVVTEEERGGVVSSKNPALAAWQDRA